MESDNKIKAMWTILNKLGKYNKDMKFGSIRN